MNIPPSMNPCFGADSSKTHFFTQNDQMISGQLTRCFLMVVSFFSYLCLDFSDGLVQPPTTPSKSNSSPLQNERKGRWSGVLLGRFHRPIFRGVYLLLNFRCGEICCFTKFLQGHSLHLLELGSLLWSHASEDPYGYWFCVDGQPSFWSGDGGHPGLRSRLFSTRCARV